MQEGSIATNLFKPVFHGYPHLQQSMICYVDALGASYLMPCLAQDPTQTAKTRDSHRHLEIRVLDETTVNQDRGAATAESGELSLLDQESNSSTVGLRSLVTPVDFNNANITEEELAAKLATYDVIREVQADVLRRHRFRSARGRNSRPPKQPQQ